MSESQAQSSYYIVACIPIARQRLGKHIPAEAKARNNRTSIARQRISQHAFLTIDAVFSALSVQSGYKDVFGSLEARFGTPICRDTSFEEEELN
jgi:hypothetical protein